MSSYREEILKEIEDAEEELIEIEVEHEARIKETKEGISQSQKQLYICDFFEDKREVDQYSWTWLGDQYNIVTVYYKDDEAPYSEVFIVDERSKKPKPVKATTVIKAYFNKKKK